MLTSASQNSYSVMQSDVNSLKIATFREAITSEIIISEKCNLNTVHYAKTRVVGGLTNVLEYLF